MTFLDIIDGFCEMGQNDSSIISWVGLITCKKIIMGSMFPTNPKERLLDRYCVEFRI